MVGNLQAFQKAMEQGHSAAWENQWDRAAGFYRLALEERPDSPQALTSLGMALVELSMYNEALVFYLHAAAITPDDPLPIERIGWINEKQGKSSDAMKAYLQAAELQLKGHDVDKAIETWRKVCSIQPDNLQARTRMALIFDRTGKKVNAVREYLVVAGRLQKNGDIAKALQVVEYCLQIVPGDRDTRQALSMLRSNQPLPKPNRPASGTTPLTPKEGSQVKEPAQPEPKSLDPINEAKQLALSQLAELLFDVNDEPPDPPEGSVNRRGIGSLTTGTGGLPTLEADRTRINLHLGQAIELETQGADVQAAEDLERAVELGLNHPAVNFDLGYLLFRRNAQKALLYLQKSVNQPEYALASFLLQGQLYQEENQFPEAVTAFLQALCQADLTTVAPDDAEELRQLYEPIIITQSQNKNPATLKNMCETVAKQLIQPDWRKDLKNFRQQLPAQPEGSPPVPLVEMLLETGSSQVVEAMAHIRQLAANNKVASASEEIYYALQFAPTYLPMHIQLGDLLVLEGRNQDAVEKFMLVAELYYLRNEPGQAIRLLRRVIKLAPMDLSVRSRLIEILSAQNQIDEAIQQYNELAEIYYRLTELDMARQTYAAALRLVQKSPNYRKWAIQILYKVADIDLQRLDLRQALRIFEQIRSLEPENIDAHVNLVILNYRLGQDAAGAAEADAFATMLENSGKRNKAIDFLGAVIAEQPEHFELRKRLADTYLRDGQMIAAVEQLDLVADARLNAGDHDGAIALLESIINLNPPNVNEYRHALAQMR
ncbi:MAG: tetratricopeptide repeat protein [Anaerolineaceae bacterium]|jgi:tetratricopeptide (TPR) repeat protein